MTNEKSTVSPWTVITVLVVAIAVVTIVVGTITLLVALVIVPAVRQAAEISGLDEAQLTQMEAEARELAAAEQELLRETNVYRVHFTTKVVKDRDFNTYDEARQFGLDTFAPELKADPDAWIWEGHNQWGFSDFGRAKATGNAFPVAPSATITHRVVMK